MSYSNYSQRDSGGAFPPVILNLLIANGMLFALQLLFHTPGQLGLLERWFALWPMGDYGGAGFYPWQLITYGFLHSTSTFFHIGINMLILWMFGREIEQTWGSKRFAIYYFTCVAGAGFLQLIIASAAFASGSPPVPTIGASGGTFGVLLAFGWMYPHRQIMLLIPPIPMKARTLVIVIGAIELLQGMSRVQTGIAHWAHLGGMLFGLLLILYWRGRFPIKPRTRLPW